MQFNISHSEEYVICVISDKPVGVDIQKIGEYNPDVAKRVCNEKELLEIENSFDKASEFTKLWTQKEAILKMYGIGIANGDIKNCIKNQEVKSQKMNDYWICYANTGGGIQIYHNVMRKIFYKDIRGKRSMEEFYDQAY